MIYRLISRTKLHNYAYKCQKKHSRTILIASSTFLLYTFSRNSHPLFYCRALSSSPSSTSSSTSAFESASDNSILKNSKSTKSSSFCSSFSSTSSSSSSSSSGSGSSSGSLINSMSSDSNNDQHKTTEELQSQWAGGRDVWKDVPLLSSKSSKKVNIQTKLKEEVEYSSSNQKMDNNVDNRPTSSNDNDKNNNSNEWPEIITSSILYGFGAYNPRGQTVSEKINKEKHLLLQNDIENGIQNENKKFQKVIWWQGASLWDDESFERGFIVAFPKNENAVEDSDYMKTGHEFIVELAKKYDQGAIYKFEFIDGKLMRETIPVLDADTDASVQVLRDGVTVDLSIFS